MSLFDDDDDLPPKDPDRGGFPWENVVAVILIILSAIAYYLYKNQQPLF